MSQAPTHRLVQLSDPHLTAGRTPFAGAIDSDAQLLAAFDRIAESGLVIDAIIVSGDLTDDGSPDAYQRLRAIFAEQSARFGVPILPGVGNHDRRETCHVHLLGEQASDAEIDYVTMINGLRIIHLDSTIPGSGAGEVTAAQLDWLRTQLASPAPAGSILVIHHPPIGYSSELLGLVALADPAPLADVLAGSDVRFLVSGHWHTPGAASFAGIPMALAGSISVATDPAFIKTGYRGLAGGQSFSIIEVFDDSIFSAVVPITPGPKLYDLETDTLRAALADSEAGRSA